MAAAHAFRHLRNDDNVQRCLRGSASSTPTEPPQTPPRPTSSTSTVSRSLPPAVRAAQTSRLSSPQLWINLLSRAFRPTAPPFPPPGPSTRSRPPTSVSGFQTMAAAASSPRVTSSQRLARRASLPSPPPPFHSSCREPLPPCLSARTPTQAAQDRSRRTRRRSWTRDPATSASRQRIIKTVVRTPLAARASVPPPYGYWYHSHVRP